MQALKEPEVQDAMRVLAKHGLGATRVHMHDEEGDMIPLGDSVVQLETDLKVSFVDQEDDRLQEATPVSWRWTPEGVQTTAYCQKNHGRCRVKLD